MRHVDGHVDRPSISFFFWIDLCAPRVTEPHVALLGCLHRTYNMDNMSYNAAIALLAPWLTLRDTNLGRVMSTCVRAAAGVYV